MSELASQISPILCIGIRGTLTRPIWLEELGPMDPVLAKQTDPNSLIALYGGKLLLISVHRLSRHHVNAFMCYYYHLLYNVTLYAYCLYVGESRETLTLFTPRNPVQVSEELCRWFGGRVTDEFSLHEHRIQNTQSASSNNGSQLDDSFSSMVRSVIG